MRNLFPGDKAGGWAGLYFSVGENINQRSSAAMRLPREYFFGFFCYQPYAAMRRRILFFGFFLLPTLCRAAAKHFDFDFFCYQPYAALRRRKISFPLIFDLILLKIFISGYQDYVLCNSLGNNKSVKRI